MNKEVIQMTASNNFFSEIKEEIIPLTSPSSNQIRTQRTGLFQRKVIDSGITLPPSTKLKDSQDAPNSQWQAVHNQPARRPIKHIDQALHQYLEEMSKIPRLTREEELEVATLAENGDEDARQKLVEANLRLVVAVARRYVRSGIPLQDLIQEGNVGLMHAAATFNTSRGCRFSTYAVWWIRHSIGRATVEQARIIRLPEYLVRRIQKVKESSDRTGKEPTNDQALKEIADDTGLSMTEVTRALKAPQVQSSLDAPMRDMEESSLADYVENLTTPGPEEIVSHAVITDELRNALSRLTMRERQVIILRFGLYDGKSRTLDEVGSELSITGERVRQLEVGALTKLRAQPATRALRYS